MNSGAFAVSLILALTGTVHSQGTLSEYTTYIGDANTWQVARIRVDTAGNTVVAGNRSSGTLSEMFVARLDSSGKMVSFLSFGGNGTDTVADMAIDAAGNIVLAGGTTSTSFPLVQPMQSTPSPGFVVKLDARGNQILLATYFPAAVTAVATDSAGNIYLTGEVFTNDFPVTPGLPANPAGGGVPYVTAAFLTKLSAAGDRIVYSMRVSGVNKPCGAGSSCFLSTRDTAGVAVAVDSSGNAYMAGNSDTTDLPVTDGALQTGGIGAFLAKVNAAGTALSYLTYIGSANYVVSPGNAPGNTARSIAVDSSGAVYLAGATFDPQFPATAGAYQTAFAGPAPLAPYQVPIGDAFVLKLKSDGSGVTWATYLGGAGADQATGIVLDGAGNVWLAGTTVSANFPNGQGWSSGGDFLLGLSANGSALVYSARYPSGTVAQSLAIDSSGLLHTAGSTGLISAIAPLSKPLPRIFGIANAAYGQVGGVMARSELISIYGPHIGPATPVSYKGTVPTSLGGVQVLMGGYALPLLYVSDSQINAAAPLSLYGSSAGLTLQVVNNGVATPLFPFASIEADPEIFQHPDGTAAAINQDGTLNSADHPAPAGSIVSIWVTGVGTATALAVSWNFSPANIVYSGPAPGAVAGVVQINFQVPAQPYATSLNTVFVTVGGVNSHDATIYTSQ